MHDLPVISTLAVGFTAAWVLGLITQRLGLSPIVGYLLAGVAIGPHTPGFTGDLEVAQQLAEVGVILLMFGVGLHFHMKDLLAVKGVAIPGAIGQSLIATLLAVFIFEALGVPMRTGAVLGMAMAVASTVVLMRVLMDADMLNTPQGHAAVGWLIVEDIFTVILLVLIPVLGTSGGAGSGAAEEARAFLPAVGLALLKLAALVMIVLVAGRRIVPWVLSRVARLRSRELFTLTVLVFSIAIAAASYYFFGASMALGAFLAGMVVAQSPVSTQAAADALPMRDAFAVLFFVSVGMLFDPHILVQQPLMIVAALVIILIGKPLAALVIVPVLGYSARTALTVAIGLAQIGEFSFILSDVARDYGLMTEAGHSILVAAAIITITLNPILFGSLSTFESKLKRRPFLWRLLNGKAERQALAANAAAAAQVEHADRGHAGLAIVVGYGPVGRSVHRLLIEARLTTVVVDLNIDTISSLTDSGQAAIFGDAAHESILEQAGIRHATHLVLTLPDPAARSNIVTAARSMNSNVRILVRARYLREREVLEQAGATAAVFEEAEAAIALARLVLADTGVHRSAADRKINELRLQLIVDNISNIRTQRLRSIMVPWVRVRWLPKSADRRAVLSLVSQERFSRWPVVETDSGRVLGYLLTKDLIATAASGDWSGHIRPLNTIHPDETIEAALTRMQNEGASVYLVADGDRPVGLVTQEDILEQVVGQIEDEYPHESPISLADAAAHGAILLDMRSGLRDQAIEELVAAIPPSTLPAGVDESEVLRLVLAREEEMSTDLGNGVAIPHARVAGLSAPVVVFGRSKSGVMYSPSADQMVHVLFLIITPAEQPETQLALLGQLGPLCSDPVLRANLMRAQTPEQVLSGLDQRGRIGVHEPERQSDRAAADAGIRR